jgi:dGTPase
MGKNDIVMSEPVAEAMKQMRNFMFENVYVNPVAKSEEKKAEALVETLYFYFMNHTGEMTKEFLNLLAEGEPKEQVVCDFIASMTDRYAIALYEDLYIPKAWTTM